MHKLSLEFIATDYYRGFILITVKGFHVKLQWQLKFLCELNLKSDTLAQVFKFLKVEVVNPVCKCMSDTGKKSMMFLNMDFRMTTSIPFLFFCLCMSKIFTIYLILFFAKLCKCYLTSSNMFRVLSWLFFLS